MDLKMFIELRLNCNCKCAAIQKIRGHRLTQSQCSLNVNREKIQSVFIMNRKRKRIQSVFITIWLASDHRSQYLPSAGDRARGQMTLTFWACIF